MADEWKKSVSELMILEMLRCKGFSKVDELTISILRELFIDHMQSLMKRIKRVTEAHRRPEANIFDLIRVLETDGADIERLTQYCKRSKDKFKKTGEQISDSNLLSFFVKMMDEFSENWSYI